MEYLCSSRFWDSNITWYTETPDFTPCFQNTVFIIIPCILFWIFGVYEFFKHSRKARTILPWSILNASQMILCIILIIITFSELCLRGFKKSIAQETPDVTIISSLIKVVTYILILSLLILHKRYGVKSSSLLSLFWFVKSSCGVIMYRSSILKSLHQDFQFLESHEFTLHMVYLPIVCCQFILSIFSSKGYRKIEKKNPMEDKSYISFISYCWLDIFIYSKRNKLLSVSDLPSLPSCLEANSVWMKFKDKWKYCFLKNDSFDVKIKNPERSLFWCLFMSFWPVIVLCTSLRIISDLFLFIPTLLLDLLIGFVSGDDYTWKGYLYCISLFVSLSASRMIFQVFMLHIGITALQIKSAICGAIYRKVMNLSNSSKTTFTSGEVLNLMTVDTEKMFNFILRSTVIISCPLKVIIIIIFLWQYLGPSCLAGLAVIMCIMPLTFFFAKMIAIIQVKQMKFKDTRLKYINEVLNSIKVLKLNAWEKPFMEKISSVRKKEVHYIKLFLYYYTGSSFFWGCAPFMIAVACFVTYVLTDETHVLTPSIVFVSLSLLNQLKFAIYSIPEVVADLVQSNTSLKRMQAFLLSEERDQSAVGNIPEAGMAISFKHAVLSWEKKSTSVLNDINLDIPQNSLVAVIGPVGCGKSSLLSAILGDMYKMSGSIDLEGTIAYVPQQAWILNDTVKGNILFGKPMETDKYLNILESCCLKPDLKLLSGADMTEIGEKGLNLSGGQKQRLSLARAVYQDADVYLLDDPLSAVDTHVGKSLFQNIIGNQGLLKDKTRILVTHNVSVLPHVDVIFSMKDGKIEEMGKYEDLIIKGGYFQEFIQEHSKIETDEASSNTEEKFKGVNQDNGGVIDEDFEISEASVLPRSNSIESVFKVNVSKLVEDETMEIGGITKKIYIDYLRHVSFGVCLPMLCFYIAYQAFEIGTNIWLAEWSNDVSFNGTQDITLRNLRIATYAGFGVVQGFCIVCGNILLAIGVTRASSKYHKSMLLSVMKSPMSFFDVTPIGRIVNRFSKDLEVIDCEIPLHFDGFIACLCFVLGTIIVIGISTPLFLAFFIPIAIFYYFLQKYYLIISRQTKRLDSITRSPVYSHFQETIQGVPSIRSYDVVERFIQNFEKKINENFVCYFSWYLCSRWLSVRLNFISNVIVLIVSLLAIENRDIVNPGVLGLTLLYAIFMTNALTYLTTNSTDLEIRAVSLERVTEYSSLMSEAPWEVPEHDPSPMWPADGVIKFQEYGTRYRKDLDLVLNGLNFDVASNEKVGIIGRTGSGKSSLTLALFRIIEAAEGSITIDDVDISKIGLQALRSKLTIIPQEPVLFCGSLRINLDPHSEFDDETLWKSLERAHLKDFVSALPSGLDHEVAEGGENLSVGQRQLVCLARALLKKSKILILDEATAAVDMDTDLLIQDTIRSEFKNHTIITIAHRLNTIMDYDKIIVMDSGKIEEVGKPSDLLSDPNSRFHALAKEANML